MLKVKFWGVRGSVASPLVGADVEEKIRKALTGFQKSGQDIEAFLASQRGNIPLTRTYGGNTSCVEIADDKGHRIVCDMGTGMRDLGVSLFKEMFEKKGLNVAFLISHNHWDHIQGLPFFGPLYMNKGLGIRNRWKFFGGTNWQATSEVCLAGQMDPPTFPVSWKEIQAITEEMETKALFDMAKFHPFDGSGPLVTARKLNHPQETYGFRIEAKGNVVAYCTDQEPFDPRCPDAALIALAKDADVVIVDCQYTKAMYEGKERGPHRHGWGHSYPEAVAHLAVQANPKQVLLFHHDPASSDEFIKSIEEQTQRLVNELGGTSEVIAAYEGLEIMLGNPSDTIIPGQLMAGQLTPQ